jgi:hypothetical protein
VLAKTKAEAIVRKFAGVDVALAQTDRKYQRVCGLK